jgi:multidrug efflux pump
MISKFFIDRPIFASVIAIVITLVGLVSMINLPIEQYPNITPPQILVTTAYPGASAETVAQAVASTLEQQINRAQGLIYMYSQSSTAGDLSLNVFFEIGTNIEQAQIDVQNQVNLVLPKLPQDVQRQGISVQKQSPTFLVIIALQSPTGRFDEIYTSNYASINIVDELQRLSGVSDVRIIGARDYSMRLWLKPDRMAQFGLTTADVISVIREQNGQYAVGRIGQAPTTTAVELTVPVTAKGRLSDPREFDEIIIRANSNGSMIRFKDIGRAELGAQNYDVVGEFNGKPTTLIAVYQQYGANALDVTSNVRAAMERLSQKFPSGMEYSIPYDTTKFVYASIKEVVKTILEAAVLVVIVVYVFLQSFRATVIPIQAMLVSIIGTFAGMYLFGLSINTLTLFGMVLAIGIVVDDAIVVIENVERNMHDLNLPPKEAAVRAMNEVTGPIIAITFVLCAVFLPVAFIGGIAGQLYKQFAITIAISVIISGLVALTLSPAVSAILLRKEEKTSRFAKGFNHFFDWASKGYVKGVAWITNRTVIGMGLFGLLCVAIIILFRIVPTSFVPSEDQGYVMSMAILPDDSSISQTEKVTRRIKKLALAEPGVEGQVSLTGFSLLEGLNKTSSGSYFTILTDWSQRTSSDLHASSILHKLSAEYSKIPEALILSFNPPSIQGMGSVGGFEFWIQNRGTGDIGYLQSVTQQFVKAANARPELSYVSSLIDADGKQFYADLDRAKARSLGIPLNEVYQALQVLLGSYYVDDFNKFGKVYRVMLQAEPDYRRTPDDIGHIYVRSQAGVMIPLKSVVTMKNSVGPALVSRFNGFPAAKVNGSAAPGYSSGQAMEALKQVAKEVLPEGLDYAWSGESYQEQKVGSSSIQVFLAGIIMVYLVLAALYERWSLPLSILLAVPFGVFGALVAIWVVGMSNDIYFQVGLVTLIALSAKNAILIVEFAIIKHQAGMSFLEAALEAARLRFRAIIMTSFTFIFGVVPLVIGSGAGAASRQSVGTGVLGGMISATVLAIFFVPLFYKLLGEMSERFKK